MADNRFLGKARALNRMRQIPPAVRRVAREAVDEQAAFLVEQIRPNVPKDEGDLANSLNWRRSLRGDRIGAIITEGANDETLGRKARAVEFGRPASAESGAMEAQPHFFPTYRANKRKMQNAIQKRIRATIARIWGSGSR
jgi:hypothetical protein